MYYSKSKSMPNVAPREAASNESGEAGAAGAANKIEGSTQRRVNNKEGSASTKHPAA